MKANQMLSDDDVEKSIVAGIDNSGWELKDERLIKYFQFSSFMNAIHFVNDVANIAERLDHHRLLQLIGRLLSFR